MVDYIKKQQKMSIKSYDLSNDKSYVIHDTYTDQLVKLDGNVYVYSGSGGGILKLYNSGSWSRILASQLAYDLERIGVYVHIDIAREIMHDAWYIQHRPDSLSRNQDLIADHKDLILSISKMKFKDQKVAVKREIDSLAVKIK